MEGYGTLNQWPLETPVLIRYGQLTSDEYFVSAGAAREGVHIYQETAAGNTSWLPFSKKDYGIHSPDRPTRYPSGVMVLVNIAPSGPRQYHF